MRGDVATQVLACPHCGEEIEVVVDLSLADQRYIEDCSVCCRPIEISITIGEDESVEVGAEAAQ
jgi:transcription elongation factor Elf1